MSEKTAVTLALQTTIISESHWFFLIRVTRIKLIYLYRMIEIDNIDNFSKLNLKYCAALGK